MIGYNKNRMVDFNRQIESIFDSVHSSKVKTLSSMYKVLMDYDETKGIHKEVFTVLFIIASLNEKNTYSLSDKQYPYIFENSIIHKLNRALYSQADTKSIISRPIPGEMESWRLYAMDKISSDEYFKVLAIMAMYYKLDINTMLIQGDELEYFLRKTSIFSSDELITFERILSAYSNYTPKQD